MQFIATAMLLAVLSATTVANDLIGRVVTVVDGDTMIIRVDNTRNVRIRLSEIDAPEYDQPWGSQARRALSYLTIGKEARVVSRTVDNFGRPLGRVFVGDLDVNLEMVKQGNAWVYRQYTKDGRLFTAEDQAHLKGKGLWSQPENDRMPPWVWRHGGKNTRKAAINGQAPVQAKPAAFACGLKHYCNEMDSCAEAKRYLKECGIESLGGSRDGIPCKNLCQ